MAGGTLRPSGTDTTQSGQLPRRVRRPAGQPKVVARAAQRPTTHKVRWRTGYSDAVIADSVRLALPAEAGSIAALQRRGWTQSMPAEVVSDVLASVDLATMTASWEQAILRPPLAQFRVLVAVGDGRVVGFAAVGPSDDPDAEAGSDALVAEFMVDPQAQRRGHGSRLLHACVDTLRADAFVRATWWASATDDVLRSFLTAGGWAADGAHTEVAATDGGPRLKLVRLHTAIA